MTYYDYYDGSRIFLFLSIKIGLPLDVVNFLIAQVAALCLARLFRKPLRSASLEFRHSVCLVIGLLMGYFCFGRQAIHLSVLPMLTYTLLKSVSNQTVGNVSLAVSMIYLSCLHVHRQIYHTDDYTLDITGPLMVITQRVTSLAYLLQDSLTAKAELTSKATNSQIVKIEKIPSPLEYFAFTLAFQTLMCGPVVFYSDYIKFIEGARVDEFEQRKDVMEPSPRRAVFYKVGGSVAAAVLYLTLAKKYPLTVLEELTDPTSEVSRSWSALYLLWYAYLSTLVVRCKYYHAWLLSEAICNNCGMGFNGYDNDGTPKWDKMSNIDIFGFEFAQNFRIAVSSWNKNTNAWLRDVAYERGGAAWRTARVYALSAVWHGFHPGYYLTFFAGGLFTIAARKIRCVARPMFLDSPPKKLFYDSLTFITTRVAMTYATVPFVLLHLAPSLAFYGFAQFVMEGRSRSVTPVMGGERGPDRQSAARRALLLDLVHDNPAREPENSMSPPPCSYALPVEVTPGGSVNLRGEAVLIEKTPGGHVHIGQARKSRQPSLDLPLWKFYYSLHFIALGAMLIPEKPSRIKEQPLKRQVSIKETSTSNDTTENLNGKLKIT